MFLSEALGWVLLACWAEERRSEGLEDGTEWRDVNAPVLVLMHGGAGGDGWRDVGAVVEGVGAFAGGGEGAVGGDDVGGVVEVAASVVAAQCVGIVVVRSGGPAG